MNNEEKLLRVLKKLLKTTELNLDEIEDYTADVIEEAWNVIAEIEGEE